jgi:hypothetical protein
MRFLLGAAVGMLPMAVPIEASPQEGAARGDVRAVTASRHVGARLRRQLERVAQASMPPP